MLTISQASEQARSALNEIARAQVHAGVELDDAIKGLAALIQIAPEHRAALDDILRAVERARAELGYGYQPE